jgi:hypothetical protein
MKGVSKISSSTITIILSDYRHRDCHLLNRGRHLLRVRLGNQHQLGRRHLPRVRPHVQEHLLQLEWDARARTLHPQRHHHHRVKQQISGKQRELLQQPLDKIQMRL